MNTQEDVIKKLQKFFNSQEKFFFLNGTHQHQKHPLAIAAAVQFTAHSSAILFRTNGKQNTGMFLRGAGIKQVPEPGAFIRVGNHQLCADTINPASWKKTASTVDIAIVYPIDSLQGDQRDRCVQDLEYRNAKKILLVTWTDNKTFSWVNQYNPIRATYDAEAERPDYHAEIKGIEAETMANDTPKNLPAYALSAQASHLCRIHCNTCNSSTWAELNMAYHYSAPHFSW